MAKNGRKGERLKVEWIEFEEIQFRLHWRNNHFQSRLNFPFVNKTQLFFAFIQSQLANSFTPKRKKVSGEQNDDKHFILLSIGKSLWLSAIYSTSTVGPKGKPDCLADFAHSNISHDNSLRKLCQQHFLEEQERVGDFQHRKLDSGESGNLPRNDLNIKQIFIHSSSQTL